MAISISGTVMKTGAIGLSGVSLKLFRAGNVIDTQVSDVDGKFQFSGLPTGDYVIEPSLANYLFSPTSKSWLPLEVNIPNFVFNASVLSISGRTRSLDPTADLGGVDLILSGPLSNNSESAHVVSNETSGIYQFNNIEIGKSYTVDSHKLGWIPMKSPATVESVQRPTTLDLYFTKDASIPIAYIYVTEILTVIGSTLGSSSVAVLAAFLYLRWKKYRLARDPNQDPSLADPVEMDDFTKFTDNSTVDDVFETYSGQSIESLDADYPGLSEVSSMPLNELSTDQGIVVGEVFEKLNMDIDADQLIQDFLASTSEINSIMTLDKVPADLMPDFLEGLLSDENINAAKDIVQSLKQFLKNNNALTEPSSGVSEGGGVDSSMSPEQIADEVAEAAADGEGYSVDMGSDALEFELAEGGVVVSDDIGTVIVAVLDGVLA